MDNKFSMFNAPAYSTTPGATWTLKEAYDYITSDAAKEATNHLRSIDATNLKARKEYKKHNFKYALFSGVFSYRNVEGLIKHSNLLCLDFDHIGGSDEVENLKNALANDEQLEARLIFTSPSGDGVKAVVACAANDASEHKLWFRAFFNYFNAKYGIELDKNPSSVASAAFLPYDAKAIIK